MVEYTSDMWRGQVRGGDLDGYAIEVRRQGFPWALYLVALTAPGEEGEAVVGFAAGRPRLVSLFEDLEVVVTWDDGRGPLAPERSRVSGSMPRRRRRAKRRTHLRPMNLGGGFSSLRLR